MISLNNSRSLKGIGILFVIISHVVAIFGIRYATPLGGIGVSIFLFLSGYGLNESYKKNGLDNFFSKRFIKVLYPYILIVLVNAIVQTNSINTIFKQIILIETPNFMWFIQFIIINYLCFYCINKYIFNKIFKNIIWIATGILFFFFGSSLVAEQSIIFYLGLMLSNNKDKIVQITISKKLVLSLFLISIGLFCLLLKQTPIIRSAHEQIYYIIEMIIKNGIGLGVIVLVNNNILNVTCINKVLTKIGDYSYELYLIHAILIFILQDNIGIYGLVLFIIFTISGAFLLKKLVNINYLSSTRR